MLRSHAAAPVILAGVMAASLQAQADWPGYGRDKGAQRYSPLAQIDTRNVAKLIPAWTFSMRRDGLPFRPSQSIPIVVDGIMYLG
jgi:glucose dehydrogenase